MNITASACIQCSTGRGGHSPLFVASDNKEMHFSSPPIVLATSAPARSACRQLELLDQAKLSYSPADAPTACEFHPDTQALSFPIRIHTGRTRSSDIYCCLIFYLASPFQVSGNSWKDNSMCFRP